MLELLLLALLAQSQPQPRDTRSVGPTPSSATLIGFVTTDEAAPRPLRRARVSLNGASLEMPRSAITADDGSFSFRGVPAGRYTLAADKDAYVPMNYGAVRTGRPGTPLLLAAGEVTRVTIRLPRGAVVTGTVTDVDGLPAQGTAVTAFERRFVAAAREFRYVPAGSAASPTDDRGIYRIYGLPAGDYVIAAQPGTPNGPAAFYSPPVRTMAQGGLSRRSLVAAPVYFPGAVDVTRAARINVRAAEERSGVDMQLQYVPLATITGTAPSGGSEWWPAQVTMIRIDETTGGQAAYLGHADSDGRFSFASVVPGGYRVLATSARLNASDDTRFGSIDVTIGGEDLDNLAIPLQPGLTIRGRVVFDGGPPPVRPPSDLTIGVPLTPAGWPGPRAFPPVHFAPDGTFSVQGIIPGSYRLGSNLPVIRGWWLKSIAAGGIELLDAPFDLRQNLEDAVVTFTNHVSEVFGVVSGAGGRPQSDVFVIAVTTDRSAWFSGSRRIDAVRSRADGRYAIRNLPPGDYRVAAAADLEPGEWFDPAVLEQLLAGAAPLTIADDGTKVLNLTIR